MKFNERSRKLNSMLASSAGMVNQIIQIVGSFVYRTVFLMILSREYLGINGLFSNVLQIFSLAELGIGSAIAYNLYGAFAQKNMEKIGQLIPFYKKVYSVIGICVLAIGIAFYPFLGTIVNVEEIPSDVSLTAVYFLFLMSSVSSYLFVYKQSLLSADQQEHKVVLFQIVTTIAGYIVRLTVLFLFANFVLVLVVDIAVSLTLNY